MAASPRFKVYSASGEYIGCAKYAEEAAALVALRGDGATVRLDHKHVVWTEGQEDQSAGESYDYAAGVMYERQAVYEYRSSRSGRSVAS